MCCWAVHKSQEPRYVIIEENRHSSRGLRNGGFAPYMGNFSIWCMAQIKFVQNMVKKPIFCWN